MTEPTTLNIVSDTNFWDFLSTAATVGLPAYITYKITKSNSKIELQREKERHNNDMNKIQHEFQNSTNKNKNEKVFQIIEEVNDELIIYFNSIIKLKHTMLNLAINDSDVYIKNLHKNEREKYTIALEHYLHTRIDNVAKANSLLNIINEQGCVSKLHKHNRYCIDIINDISMNKEPIMNDHDTLEKFDEGESKLRKELYIEINKVFENLFK